MYFVVSSSRRWPTVPAMTIERMDVTTIRAINPTAMPTIFLLIDRLNIRCVRLQEMVVQVNFRPGGRGETIIAGQFAKYREMLARPLDRDQGRKRPLANLALITYCLDLLLCKITSIAFANPSSSFEAVTRVACRLTSSVALPIANERPLARNIGRSFCISPTVATASVETPRRCAIVRTKVPLSLPGGVMSR